MFNKIIKTLCLILFISTSIIAQENVKIMSYNLLNYPQGSNLAERNSYFKIIMDEVQPDILVAQEIQSGAAKYYFIDDVLGNKYNVSSFIDGPYSDNLVYFKDSLFQFVSNKAIKTTLRDINEFRLVHKITLDTLLIYSVHLKASQGSEEEARRLAEVKELRKVTDLLSEDANYIICGDFNFYSASELAFQELLDQSNSGYVLDPIDQIGNWHDNSSYQQYHTQSPRTTQFGGGSHGGMDDRFDFILVSQALMDNGGIDYIEDSYLAYGNDSNHFNLAINAGTNSAVPDSVANALHGASDHLPVIAEFLFDGTTAVGLEDEAAIINSYQLKQNYPNPFNPETTIEYNISVGNGHARSVQLTIYDVLGNQVANLVNEVKNPGKYKVTWNAENLSSGIYIYQLRSGVFFDSKKMILLK
ncbi:MAG: T9SS type A sorting domain-containing protein [Melioribacteraceae bacterium]|nr:T9SS type A sorting domain-containing protein [Melioribacteraceae bacterium]